MFISINNNAKIYHCYKAFITIKHIIIGFFDLNPYGVVVIGIYEDDGPEHHNILGLLVRQMSYIPDPGGYFVHGTS